MLQLMVCQCCFYMEVMAASSRYASGDDVCVADPLSTLTHQQAKAVCGWQTRPDDTQHKLQQGISVADVQVRSLASETARQSESDGRTQLAWYAAGFHEEMSAFDGVLLVWLSSCIALGQFIILHPGL